MVESDDAGHDLKKYVAIRGQYLNGHWKLFDALVYDMQRKDNEAGSTQNLPEVDLPDWSKQPSARVIAPGQPAEIVLMRPLANPSRPASRYVIQTILKY